ncbi:SCL-interrupting locus protein homolog [Odontesthes bonariensis]
MSCPVNFQALPSGVLEEVFTPENIRRRASASSLTQLSFPKSRSALWDSSPAGEKLRLQLCSRRKPRVVLLEKALRLAQRHVRHSKKPRLLCFFLGSLCVPDEAGVTLTLDRFDPGRDQAGASGRVPSALLPGDVLVSCLFSVQSEATPDAVVQSEAELHQSFQLLQKFLSSRQTLDLSQLLKIRAHVFCSQRPDAAAFSLSWSAVCPAVGVDVQPVRAVPIIPTALLRSLTSVGRPLQHTGRQRGFLTMDQTRKLVLLLESDPKASKLPLVGLWLSGVTHVSNPQVWAWCLRFMFSSAVQDRVLSESSCFLLVVFASTHRAPQFFQCRGSGPGPEPQLGFQLLTASQSVTLYQVAPADGRALRCELGSEDRSRQAEVFRAAQISFSSSPPPAAGLSISDQDSGVEDEDFSPRPSPSPHPPAPQARRIQPSVPELSLLIDSSFSSNHTAGSAHRPPPDRKSAPPTGPTSSSASKPAPPPPPHLHSTPNSNLQQPCTCCSTHNCTSIFSSPAIPPAAPPASTHHTPCPSNLHPAPTPFSTRMQTPPPSKLHSSPLPPSSSHRQTPPPSNLHSSPLPPSFSHRQTPPPSNLNSSPLPPSSTHRQTPPPSNLNSSPLPPSSTHRQTPPPSNLNSSHLPPSSTHRQTPPPSNLNSSPLTPSSTHRQTPPPSNLNSSPLPPSSTHRQTPPPSNLHSSPLPPSLPQETPPPSCLHSTPPPSSPHLALPHPSSDQYFLPPSSQPAPSFGPPPPPSLHHNSSPPSLNPSIHHYTPLPSSPSPSTLVLPPDPSSPCIHPPPLVSRCCDHAVPPDTYQLLLHQDRQLRLLQAQVQMLLEAQGKLQSSTRPADTQTPRSTASIAVETGASLFWGSDPLQEEQASSPKPPPSASSSPATSSHDLSVRRPVHAPKDDDITPFHEHSVGGRQSPVLGESVSMYEAADEQQSFYHNLMTQLNTRLQDADSQQEAEDESRRRSLSVSDRSQSSQSSQSSSSSSQRKPSPEGDPVIRATLRQLQQLGVDVDQEDLTESDRTRLKAVESASMLASINPAAVISRLSAASEPTTSALFPGGSVDLSLEANAIALRYLSDSQLSRLSLGGHAPQKSPAPSSADSLLSPSNMSLATRKYMRRYGLIEEEDGEEEARQPLTEAQNLKLLPQSQLIRDLRPKMQLLADGTEPDGEDKENRSTGRPSLIRGRSRQPEGSVGNILDLSRLRQLPKLF